MTAVFLLAARDTSLYFYSAYAAIGVIITIYSCTLYVRTRKAKRGEHGK